MMRHFVVFVHLGKGLCVHDDRWMQNIQSGKAQFNHKGDKK